MGTCFLHKFCSAFGDKTSFKCVHFLPILFFSFLHPGFFKGENCQVKHPRYGYTYNLTPLSEKDVLVSTEEYDYYFRVCGGLSTGTCKAPAAATDVVASCQIKKQSQPFKKIAGKVIVGLLTPVIRIQSLQSFVRMDVWSTKIHCQRKCPVASAQLGSISHSQLGAPACSN